MYKDDYISAFGKLAPSEEWMTDTLAKIARRRGGAGSAGRGRAAGTARFGQKTSAPAPRGTARRGGGGAADLAAGVPRGKAARELHIFKELSLPEGF